MLGCKVAALTLLKDVCVVCVCVSSKGGMFKAAHLGKKTLGV